MTKKIIVAIDGYSSCGKSSMARTLARAIDYIYVDTGAMYRGVTLFALRRGFIREGVIQEAELREALNEVSLSFRQSYEGATPELYLNGENVEKEIRTELLSEALAKKFDVQVSQQELIDYAIQMSQNFGIDINQLFSSSQQMANVVADLGRSKALIEALKVVTVKDANGADVDLSKFFGTDPATEEGAEIITEVADEQE